MKVRVIEVMNIGVEPMMIFFDWEYREAGKVFYPQAPMVCEVFEKVE